MLVELIKRTDPLNLSTYRHKRAAEVFAKHPHVHTLEVHRRGDGIKDAHPRDGIAVYLLSYRAGHNVRRAEFRIPEPRQPRLPNRCPLCGGRSFRMDAVFTGEVCVTFSADDPEDFDVDDSEPGDSEWTGPVSCRECPWSGNLKDLESV